MRYFKHQLKDNLMILETNDDLLILRQCYAGEELDRFGAFVGLSFLKKPHVRKEWDELNDGEVFLELL